MGQVDKLIREDFERVLIELATRTFPMYTSHSEGFGLSQTPPSSTVGGTAGDVEIEECQGCERELPCLYVEFNDFEKYDGWYCYECSRE